MDASKDDFGGGPSSGGNTGGPAGGGEGTAQDARDTLALGRARAAAAQRAAQRARDAAMGGATTTVTTPTTTTVTQPGSDTFIPSVPSTFYNARVVPKFTVADYYAPPIKPVETVATVRNPFTDLTKDVLNPDDDTQVDSLTEKDDEGIMAAVKEILSNTLIGKGIGYLKEQYDKQKAKDLFANTMDPSPPPVDTIASLTAGLGGGEGQGLASIYTGPPALRAIEPVSPIIEEEVVDPRTAEMEAFRAILRRNLGLI